MVNDPAIRAQKNVSADGGVDVSIFSVSEGKAFQGFVSYADDASAESVHESLTITTERAQALLDDLWDAGIRPSRQPEPVKFIAALERHNGQLFELAKTLAAK